MATDQSSGLRHAGRALRHRNYRLYFMGQAVSLVGTWITRVAQQWLVYRLTNSPLWLGLIGFCMQVPTSILSAPAGVLADRWDRRKMLLATQILAMMKSLTLAALAFSGKIQVWHVAALALFQGVVDSFEIPARQSLAVELTGREDLPNAIALNSMLFNGGRMVGPAIAGVLVAAVGEGTCFLVDGVSFLAVIAMLLAMNLVPKAAAHKNGSVWQGLREGVSYARSHPNIRAVLVLLGVISLLGFPHLVLMPIFATKIFAGDANTLGRLVASAGTGALLGTFFLATRSAKAPSARLVRAACVTGGAALMGFSYSSLLPLSMVLLAVTGFSMLVVITSGNVLVQTLVNDQMRGRVMALFGVAVIGALPYGSLLAGALAEKIGAQATVLLGGLVCVLAGLFLTEKLHVEEAPSAIEPIPAPEMAE
ncbi:MAG: MFS transporter [Bdellovibrionota bacterium]